MRSLVIEELIIVFPFYDKGLKVKSFKEAIELFAISSMRAFDFPILFRAGWTIELMVDFALLTGLGEGMFLR